MSEIEKAVIVLIEDDAENARKIRDILHQGGHAIIEELCWVATAMNAVDTFEELGVNVVLLDRDIFGGNIVDAGFISRTREFAPGVRIIGTAADPIEEVDVDLTKKGIEKLNEVITILLDKKG
ncbi:hypothetical protein A2701_04545 [Candidatus Amesbacteria bacterium RIFCSPHIGHO2_01_FULL_47_34]|uniref:Response regulatory domain-containing protein n=3 Tax=Candidatus Amesiibacteriota TaxID=1752730 RepID=A0A1F4ZX60_9BACT|nr:MAG: hypothetical protein UX86_C0008G0019 [Candidatus Amesbacteria bacterium GW2011_GWC1_47_15]OGC99744.1 MAG: hypothetical protein A2972_01935 [Candidatus Amesbacteria bacterium RIFCSPLOWO2_01_FULL_47_33]OGD00601.1 MAG: hypothetical protein A2701_04545 [Candidatus Amesbacteria bacterium RIFCSPHIGHO2_01_FULL_47_34]OGD10931.1 MAG: hypothetical protein A2395_00375 [Candidatus Amesbacteria bacterium RIFOXYB1_FULL_47_9]